MNPRPWDPKGSPACEAGVRTAELPALTWFQVVRYLTKPLFSRVRPGKKAKSFPNQVAL